MGDSQLHEPKFEGAPLEDQFPHHETVKVDEDPVLLLTNKKVDALVRGSDENSLENN